MCENLVIYYNDSIDSDNLASALALWKATYRRPNTRVLWIHEPRQVCFGLSMTAEQKSRCQDLLQKHFTCPDGTFKVLLGGLLKQEALDNIEELEEADRELLQMAVKPNYGPKEDSVLHGCLAAWDFASCLVSWSNDARHEVAIDFDSLDHIENPVNLNLHHHEELPHRSEDELATYHQIMADTSPRRVGRLQDWYRKCATRKKNEHSKSRVSIEALELQSLCDRITAAASVQFFGGSSPRILEQTLGKGVAKKMKCHLQLFNIALNQSAAKVVLDRHAEFSQFTVVPSQTVQQIKYSALGLERVGGNHLEKQILGFNYHKDPTEIATGKVSLRNDYPARTLPMPDLTAFLCGLVPQYGDACLTFARTRVSDSTGAILFEPASDGIKMFVTTRDKILEESDVVDLFASLEHSKVSLDWIREARCTENVA
ncbi:hypothetical protein FSARC_8864 [Fusarium sarcochroum]|uniref:Uncharacterized protein n=1 Tax=Fusarium sarcochroum TaxID=1208366 RepID=A0A8H4X6T2_9HYPO|nr:hypothetical protein FSARC_8864 [Fusarium sarcochroum]